VKSATQSQLSRDSSPKISKNAPSSNLEPRQRNKPRGPPPTIGLPPVFAEDEGLVPPLSGSDKFKGHHTIICWMEGLLLKIPDIYGMFLPRRLTMMKAKQRLTEFSHYACEVLRANELSFMVALQKDVPSYLTSIIDNLFEAATFWVTSEIRRQSKRTGGPFL
jgi:hypothetical protein